MSIREEVDKYLSDNGITGSKDWRKLHSLNVEKHNYPKDVTYSKKYSDNYEHLMKWWSEQKPKRTQKEYTMQSPPDLVDAKLSTPVRRAAPKPKPKPAPEPAPTRRAAPRPSPKPKPEPNIAFKAIKEKEKLERDGNYVRILRNNEIYTQNRLLRLSMILKYNKQLNRFIDKNVPNPYKYAAYMEKPKSRSKTLKTFAMADQDKGLYTEIVKDNELYVYNSRTGKAGIFSYNPSTKKFTNMNIADPYQYAKDNGLKVLHGTLLDAYSDIDVDPNPQTVD